MTYPVPYLLFKDPRGLELSSFNTIRLGGGWAKRLKAGQRVLLVTKLEVIGSAKVAYVHTGPVEEMLLLYAAGNHIERAISIEESYSHKDAPKRRLASMYKNYGPRLVPAGVKVSVIGLVR